LPNQKDGLIAELVNADYYSPFNLAISGDGKKLYAVAEEGNKLLIIDTEKRKVSDEIPVGVRPHSVVLDNKRNKAYVTNQWSDNVSVIDLDKNSVEYTLKTGNGPAGIELSSDKRFLYVVNSYSSDLSVFDLNSGAEVKRLTIGNNPTGIAMSPDRNRLYITSRRALIAPYGKPVICELSVINDNSQRIAEYKDVESAYMMENVAFTPEGDLALIPLIRPKNLVPSIQVERGFIMTNGIGIIEQKPDGRDNTAPA
jgi:YVTN family beta-propeller protein